MLLDEPKYSTFSDPDWLYEIKYASYRMLVATIRTQRKNKGFP